MRGFFSDECFFDLLGNPIPENWGKRGRPPHIPTERNRNKIKFLLAFGWTKARITRALRIIGKTLTKHYFRELRQRDEAPPRDRGESKSPWPLSPRPVR